MNSITSRHILALLLMVFGLSLPGHAVLKEKNLPSTLAVLRAELQSTYNEQQQNIARFNISTNAQHRSMVQMMQKSDQIGLMLYSQKQDFTFDMTYACHEATSLYREFSTRRMPYTKILSRIDMEIDRYEKLIASLSAMPPQVDEQGHTVKMPPIPDDSLARLARATAPAKGKQPFVLTGETLDDRNACLRLASKLKGNLESVKARIIQDNEHYHHTAEKLKALNDYALQRYNAIQHSIFINGDASYFQVLGAFSNYLKNAKADVNEKYNVEHVKEQDGKMHIVQSQWRGPIVTGLTFFVLFYVIIAALLSNVLVRFLVPKRFRTEEFMKKKVCLILAVAMVVFALSVMIVRSFMDHNFFLMASRLLIEYSWLLCAIFISLLIRLNGDQVKSGFRIYSPIMLMSFIVITFRIIFIPNNLVQLIFPPILLVFTLWQ